MKGPKDSKDSHTSVTMEGTLGNGLDCSHLPLSGFADSGALLACVHAHVRVCERVHARKPASVPRQLASYKRAPPQDASRRLAPSSSSSSPSTRRPPRPPPPC